ncbi:MAG: YbaY family lipoprotein [Reyranellaceae bacterium]
MWSNTAAIGLVACLCAGSAVAQQGRELSTTALSRCAGKVGSEIRQADPAFPTFGLDGIPWITVDRTDEQVGSQPIATTISGTGWRRRRDGTEVPYRYTCVLDAEGQAVMFHATPLQRNLGDALPPAIVIEGAAGYRERMALPRGVELQVQLIDTSRSPQGEVLTEQVVRSGWQVPIPFSLRLPKDLSLAGRKLEITARFVLARQPLFQLEEKRPLSEQDLHKFILLTLSKVDGASSANAPAQPR